MDPISPVWVHRHKVGTDVQTYRKTPPTGTRDSRVDTATDSSIHPLVDPSSPQSVSCSSLPQVQSKSWTDSPPPRSARGGDRSCPCSRSCRTGLQGPSEKGREEGSSRGSEKGPWDSERKSHTVEEPQGGHGSPTKTRPGRRPAGIETDGGGGRGERDGGTSLRGGSEGRVRQLQGGMETGRETLRGTRRWCFGETRRRAETRYTGPPARRREPRRSRRAARRRPHSGRGNKKGRNVVTEPPRVHRAGAPPGTTGTTATALGATGTRGRAPAVLARPRGPLPTAPRARGAPLV